MSEVKISCVYVIRDKECRVNDYNLEMIRDLKEKCDELFVMIGSGTSDAQETGIHGITENVIRLGEITEDPIGLYKEFLRKGLISKDAGKIVFMNDEWYGPVCDTKALFEKMTENKQEWCLLKECRKDFFVLNAENADMNAVINKLDHIDSADLKEAVPAGETEGYSDCPGMDLPVCLMEEQGLPYVRRALFETDYTSVSDSCSGDAPQDVMRYLRDRSKYDSDLIMKHLIRTQSVSELEKILQLNVVLSSKVKLPGKNKIGKTALLIQLNHADQAEYCRHYAESMPEGNDVFIVVPDEEKKKTAERAFQDFPYHTEIKVSTGINETGKPDLTERIGNYDLVCSVHDIDHAQSSPKSVEESRAYKCFENLLKNKTYVENVIAHFEENKLLGTALPPVMIHGPYYLKTADASEETMCWYRPDASEGGYYTEHIMADTFAKIEVDNIDYMNHELFAQEMRITGEVPFNEMISIMKGENS